MINLYIEVILQNVEEFFFQITLETTIMRKISKLKKKQLVLYQSQGFVNIL